MSDERTAAIQAWVDDARSREDDGTFIQRDEAVDRFGIDKSTAWRIIAGRSWVDVR